MAGNYTQNLPAVAPGTSGMTVVPSNTGKVAIDTYLPSGADPQAVAATPRR